MIGAGAVPESRATAKGTGAIAGIARTRFLRGFLGRVADSVSGFTPRRAFPRDREGGARSSPSTHRRRRAVARLGFSVRSLQ
jgi:hypothetical protein